MSRPRYVDRLKLKDESYKKGRLRTVTVKQFIEKFFRSRFNRDNLQPIRDDEDVNDSGYYRLYAKKDLMEIGEMFRQFFIWFLAHEDFDTIRLSPDFIFCRNIDLPHIKKANKVDVLFCKDQGVEDGKYYVTKGKYRFEFIPSGEYHKELLRFWHRDERRREIVANLEKECKEKNKNL